MNMRLVCILSWAAAPLILGGCGNNTLELHEARAAYAAYQSRFGDSAAVRLQSNSNHDCAGGGHFHLRDAKTHAPHLVIEGELVGCASRGIIMDGDTKAQHRTKHPPSATPSVTTLEEEGELELRGAVQGSCSIDLQTDHRPATHSVLARRGQFCGYPVMQLVP